jgi:hypothetical protein
MPGLASSADDDLDRLVGRRGPGLEGRLGNVEHTILVAGPRQANDHLPGVDDLPRFRARCGDDAVEFGDQIGVAELVLGQVARSLGRIDFGFGGAQVLDGGIVGGAVVTPVVSS